jgi:hypothetical protein
MVKTGRRDEHRTTGRNRVDVAERAVFDAGANDCCGELDELIDVNGRVAGTRYAAYAMSELDSERV